jgi:hypothetical protein
MTHTADISSSRHRVTVAAEVIDQAAKHVHHASVDVLSGTDERGDTVTFQMARPAFLQLVVGVDARAGIDVMVDARDVISVTPEAAEDEIGDARDAALTAYAGYKRSKRSGHRSAEDYRPVTDALVAYCVASGLSLYTALAEIHAAWVRRYSAQLA